MSLPQDIRLTLMGNDAWAYRLFAASLLVVLLALFFGLKQMLWPAVGATLLTVVGMVLVRDGIAPRQYQGSPYPLGSNGSCKVCHTIDMKEEIHHPNMLAGSRNTVE